MFYNNHFFRKPNVVCFSIAKVMYRPKSNFHVFTKAEIRKNHLNLFRSTDRGGSRTAAASKMEHFVIIVNGWKPLTIITKSSILDVATVLDPSLDQNKKKFMKSK